MRGVIIGPAPCWASHLSGPAALGHLEHHILDVPDQANNPDGIMNSTGGFQGKPYPGLGPLNCP